MELERLLGGVPGLVWRGGISAWAHRLGLDQREQVGCWLKTAFLNPVQGLGKQVSDVFLITPPMGFPRQAAGGLHISHPCLFRISLFLH